MKEQYYFESHGQIHRVDLYFDPTESNMCYYVFWNLHDGLVESDGFDTLEQMRLILNYFNAKERKEDIE